MILAAIIIAALVLVAAGLACFHFRRRSYGMQVLEMFEQLAAAMPVESAAIQKIPNFELSGVYRASPIIIESSVKKINDKKASYWRVFISMKDALKERYYIQSETYDGKLVKVVSLDVVSTDDEAFDKKFLVFSSNALLAKKVFNAYLRQRFLREELSSFAIEARGREAVLEFYSPEMPAAGRIRGAIEVMAEFLNIVQVAG